MSKTTLSPTILGPALPVLDDPDLEGLPGYLSEAAKRSLKEPRQDLLLAAVSAGQLLRVGDLRRIARSSADRWILGLDQETLEVLGGTGEQLLSEASAALGAFLASTPEARDLVRSASPDVDPEPDETPPTEAVEPGGLEGWLEVCLQRREQAESLLVVLGRAALNGKDEGTVRSAALAERQLRSLATSVDETLRSLMPLLGDHLNARILEDPWLCRAAPLQLDLPWMTLLFTRTRREKSRAAARAGASSKSAQVLYLFLPKREPRPLALAAHGQENQPMPAKGGQRRVVGPLRIELSRPASAESSGEFTISLALEDGSELDLLEKAVKLLDERGVSCEPVAKGTRPRRWWGHFRGEGRFKLVVDGVLQDIPEIVIEKEK